MMIFAGILGLAQSLFLPALIVMKLAKLRGGCDIYTDYPAYFLPGYSECCSSADLTDTGQMSQVLNGEKVQWMLLPEVRTTRTGRRKSSINASRTASASNRRAAMGITRITVFIKSTENKPLGEKECISRS